MKRIADYLVLALCITFWGCEGLLPVIPEESPVDKMVTITATVVGANGTIDPYGVSEIKIGGSKTYTITPNIGYSTLSIKVDGVDVPVCGTYEFKNVTQKRSSIVVEFISTNVPLLIQKSWKNISYQNRPVGTSVWYDLIGESAVLTGTYLFYSNFRFEHLDDENIPSGNGSYILKQDSLIIGPNLQGGDGLRSKIILLTDDSLRIRLVSKYYGDDGHPDSEIQCTYIH